MYILFLNDMRSSNIENTQAVFRSETKETLFAFIQAEKVPVYRDGTWSKVFRKGGQLEWYNFPYDMESALTNLGTEDDVAEKARREYRVVSEMLIEV